mmetsp:Transcript_39555/g.88496  ORF Transcript_39555/g.88496 Transcript_39555/m.88496 type:complete len:182 (+) Transcript_39555:163-708(+)
MKSKKGEVVELNSHRSGSTPKNGRVTTPLRKKRLFEEAIRNQRDLLDTDQDGKLSIDEVLAAGRRLGLSDEETKTFYDSLDGDHDGNLTETETKKSWTGSFLLFNIIVAPILLIVMSFILGGILVGVEGWTWIDGFYFIAQDVTCLANPLFAPDEKLATATELVQIIVSVIARENPPSNKV